MDQVKECRTEKTYCDWILRYAVVSPLDTWESMFEVS